MIYVFAAIFAIMIVATLYVAFHMAWRMLIETSMDFAEYLVCIIVIGSALFLGFLALGGLKVTIGNL